MNQITIEKQKLVERITENRKNHIELHKTVTKGYYEAAAKHFAKQLKRAQAGKPFARSFDDFPPESHEGDYDAVLDMLDMEVEDTIKLSRQEFLQYMRDEWDWKDRYIASNTKFIR